MSKMEVTIMPNLLSGILVASSGSDATITGRYKNIDTSNLLAMLRSPLVGCKDGSNFLRTSLKIGYDGKCLSRSNMATASLARLCILDCDKSICQETGEELEGAPSPQLVSDILRSLGIFHVLYGSYSHYNGSKGNRYRILLITSQPYEKNQLLPTVESIISLLNRNITGNKLANATENRTWSQPWYYPRRPENSDIGTLYLEYLEGNPIDVVYPQVLPHKRNAKRTLTIAGASKDLSVIDIPNEISPIDAFNVQYPIRKLLSHYGYKFSYNTQEGERWLSPSSCSGIPGINVREGKFYSHHADEFNDNYWHDSFDLLRIKEHLSYRDAVIFAAKYAKAPDGRSIDEWNKSCRYTRAGQREQVSHI
jgi:hypothetical protein